MNQCGRLASDWKDVKTVIAYGYGQYSHEYLELLHINVDIACIVDNAPEQKGGTHKGIPIYAWEEVPMPLKKKYKIVVMAETIMRSQIKDALVAEGLEEYKDFADFERFYSEWGYVAKHELRLLELHTAVTTNCSFRCKKCNMLVPFHKQFHESNIESMVDDLKVLFQKIDYVYKYQIVGGEPLLFKNLGEYVNKVCEEFRENIGFVRVITNGSVIPNATLLDIFGKNRVEVHISDYTNAIQYTDKIDQVKKVLDDNGIVYRELKSLKWRDIGFPDKQRMESNYLIKKHMDLCGTSWHGLKEGRVYYCNCAWSAEASGLFKNEEDDYIELNRLEDGEGWRVLQLCLGDIGKGYNSYCAFCGGCGEDNNSFVNAGEQME